MPDTSELEVVIEAVDAVLGASALPGQAQPGIFLPGTPVKFLEVEVVVE